MVRRIISVNAAIAVDREQKPEAPRRRRFSGLCQWRDLRNPQGELRLQLTGFNRRVPGDLHGRRVEIGWRKAFQNRNPFEMRLLLPRKKPF
jgi:hypothetical protein